MTEPLNDYEGARVLVLGAGGFIGLWVVRLLSEAGADVVAVIRSDSSADDLNYFGVDTTIRKADLLSGDDLEYLIATERPSIVFNLAGYGIDRSETHEATAFRVNSELVKRLCESLEGLPADGWEGLRLVHVGSAMEYGAVPGDLKEDSETSPTTAYGRSKLAGTLALKEHCERSGLKGATGRLFAVYGPGEAPTRLLPTLIGRAGDEKPIEFTEGLHRRDFTYVEDAAEGLLRLGLSAAAPGSVVNIATGALTSIREFTESAAGVIGIGHRRLKFGALPTRPEEMFNDGVSVEKARELLGWIPSTTIEDGVRRTIDFRGRRR